MLFQNISKFLLLSLSYSSSLCYKKHSSKFPTHPLGGGKRSHWLSIQFCFKKRSGWEMCSWPCQLLSRTPATDQAGRLGAGWQAGGPGRHGSERRHLGLQPSVQLSLDFCATFAVTPATHCQNQLRVLLTKTKKRSWEITVELKKTVKSPPFSPPHSRAC